MTPTPEAVALLAEALHADCLRQWDAMPPMFQSATTQHGVDAHLSYVHDVLTHPPLAEALRTAELARAWWASCSGRGEGNVAGRPWAALADHLLATAEGGK